MQRFLKILCFAAIPLLFSCKDRSNPAPPDGVLVSSLSEAAGNYLLADTSKSHFTYLTVTDSSITSCLTYITRMNVRDSGTSNRIDTQFVAFDSLSACTHPSSPVTRQEAQLKVKND